MNHILLFESYSQLNEEAIIESAFQLFLEAEQESKDMEDVNYDSLSSGDKAALTRGDKLTTKAQFAAAYLRALGQVDGSPNKFMSDVINADDEALDIKDFADEKGKWTNVALADAFGMDSIRTFNYAVSKFRNMIDRVGETENNVLYPKIMSAYEEFKKLSVNNVGQIAGDSLQNKTYTKNREAHEQSLASGVQSRADSKKTQEAIGRDTYALAKTLKAHFNSKKSVEHAINKIAQTKEIKTDLVKKYFDAYIKEFDLKDFDF